MRLVASMVVRNELSRYLEPVVAHLLAFCDQVAVVDDGSDDGTLKWLAGRAGVTVDGLAETEFFAHEGMIRQRALNLALEAEPTHVLAIDGDEFVADGDLVRRLVEDHPEAPSFSLCMTEVWRATEDGIRVRCDGGWCPHRAPILWRVPEGSTPRIPEKAAAPGRIPTLVGERYREAIHTDVEILHFGWTRESERVARHARYANAESFGHNPRHIESILWTEGRVVLEERPWPEALDRESILARANPVPA